MDNHWEKVRDRLERSYYKSPRLSYRTREMFGPALDDFNTDLEDLEAKKAEVNRVISKIQDPDSRERVQNSMGMSIASTYEKLRGAVVHEREIIYSIPVTSAATFDSFLTESKASPRPALKRVAGAAPNVFERQSYIDALALIERCKGKNG